MRLLTHPHSVFPLQFSRVFCRLLGILTACIVLAHAQDKSQHTAFVFEGEIVRVDPELSREIQPRNVLSGTFRWNLATDPDTGSPGFSLYESAIDSAEFTIDRNYIALIDGQLLTAHPNHVVIHRGDPREPSPDSLAIHLPLRATPLSSRYRPIQLELYFRDDNARALQDTSLPELPPHFPQAWFVLIWQHDTDQQNTVHTEGIITSLQLLAPSPVSELSISEYQAIIRDLDQQLILRDQHITQLSQQLESAQARISSLETTLTQTRAALARAEDGSIARDLEARNHTLRQELDQLQALKDQTEAALTESLEREARLRSSNELLLREVAQSRQPQPPTVNHLPSSPSTHLREAPRFIQIPETPSSFPITSPKAEPPQPTFPDPVAESPSDVDSSTATTAAVLSRRGPRR